jgi:hypothetical protein
MAVPELEPEYCGRKSVPTDGCEIRADKHERIQSDSRLGVRTEIPNCPALWEIVKVDVLAFATAGDKSRDALADLAQPKARPSPAFGLSRATFWVNL